MVLRVATAAVVFCFLASAQNKAADTVSEQTNPAAAIPESAPLLSCTAGTPLGSIDLSVKAPQPELQPLPFQNINHLSEGDTVVYSPVLRGKEKRPGEIALVIVPSKKRPDEPFLTVTDPKDADKHQEWKMNQSVALVAFVYGPSGLSKKKVSKFLSQDDVLVAQLADYAEKTSQTEALVAALSNSESSSASVNAALNGFASQYGFAVQIDKTAPPAVQAQTLFASINPQLATYNPLSDTTAARAGQTASLATTAAALFFGSPVGLAAGGTAMLLDLRSIAFPDTQFRSSFAQTLTGSSVNLCGQKNPTPPHTRVAYIWASRIPNAPTPTIKVGSANYLPAGQKSSLPVDVQEPTWKYLQRAREWTLADSKNQTTKVPVLKLGNQKSLELDLTKTKLAPGDYRLSGYWDWVPFTADGLVHVKNLSDFQAAKLDPASQDQLVARTGKIPVTLTGADFEFTTKVELKKTGDEFATAEPVKFLLPKGLGEGPQDHMDVQIDTTNLDPGMYQLLIAQQDDKSHPVKLNVLSDPAKVTNFPVLVNQGVATQHFVLKGERLGNLVKLETPGAKLQLGDISNNGTERSITVELASNLKPGTLLPITEYLQGRANPESVSLGLQITGPLPVIASSKLSLPTGLGITTKPNEFPAGSTLTAVLDVKNIERKSVLQLFCQDDTSPRAALQIGERTNLFSLQQLSPDQLFLSYNTAALPAGCNLQAVIDNGRDGKSQAFDLARIVLMPQIDSFSANGTAPNDVTTYTIVGQNLEMIQKVAWDQTNGVDVPGLPNPIPGQGQKQSLTVNLPAPPTSQPSLFLWLRGDDQGRTTTIKPIIPVPPPPAPPAKTPTGNQQNPMSSAAVNGPPHVL
ncbi:MAG TPA: hypothetical protein VFA65_01315 [Bryobacteraceae bacterium]|nr:hypothetical protein [Bryobacteraceae bacterium]